MRGVIFPLRQPPATYRARHNRQRVIEMHAEGHDPEAIATKLGLRLALVREILRPRAVPTSTSTPPPVLSWPDFDESPLGARSAA